MFVYVLSIWREHEDAGLIMNESVYFDTYLDAYRCAQDLIVNNTIHVYSITKAPVFGTAGMDNKDEELLSYYINDQWYHGDDVMKVTYDGTERCIYLEMDTFELWNKLVPTLRKDSYPYSIWRYIDYNNEIMIEEFQGYREFCDYTLSKYTSEMIDIYKNLLTVNETNYSIRVYLREKIDELHNNWKRLVNNKV